MNRSKRVAHTPGPWNYEWVAWGIRHLNRNCDYDYRTEAGDEYLHPQRKDEDYMLVTAAPDLLAALVAVRDSEHKLPSGLWDKVNAAITKAMG